MFNFIYFRFAIKVKKSIGQLKYYIIALEFWCNCITNQLPAIKEADKIHLLRFAGLKDSISAWTKVYVIILYKSAQRFFW